MTDRMHRTGRPEDEALVRAVFDVAAQRLAMDPPPLDRAWAPTELADAAGETITPGGLGPDRALELFTDVFAPACLSMDHPRYFAFVPNAATEAATVFDLAVSASNIYGGSWLEGSGAVYAENQALRWLSDICGLPDGAGGTFVSGGSIANLSGLAVARHRWRSHRDGDGDGDGEGTAHGSGSGAQGSGSGAQGPTPRPLVVVSAGAHSSIAAALDLLDLDPFPVPADELGRLRADGLTDAVLDALDAEAERVVAVVATAGTTNTGGIDDLAAAAELADRLGTWLHVDAAYGGGALCSTTRRRCFDGIERADSVTIDPHKWLFAPYDCAAIIYREPELARRTFTQQAAYLDAVNTDGEWNPSDYGPHLSRRARGLPFWFSLATHGTDAYAAAVDRTIDVTGQAAAHVRSCEHLDLVMEPELSVLLVRRRGWDRDRYWGFCRRLAEAQVGFVVPTTWLGETVLRYCIVNPATTLDDVVATLPDPGD